MSLTPYYARLLDALDGKPPGPISKSDIETFLASLPDSVATMLRAEMSKFEVRLTIVNGKRFLTRRRRSDAGHATREKR